MDFFETQQQLYEDIGWAQYESMLAESASNNAQAQGLLNQYAPSVNLSPINADGSLNYVLIGVIGVVVLAIFYFILKK